MKPANNACISPPNGPESYAGHEALKPRLIIGGPRGELKYVRHVWRLPP